LQFAAIYAERLSIGSERLERFVAKNARFGAGESEVGAKVLIPY